MKLQPPDRRVQPLETARRGFSNHWKSRATGALLLACLAGIAQRTPADVTVSAVELVHQSRMRTGAQDLDGALALAQAAVAADPGYFDGWKQQGRVLMLRGEMEKANETFATALRLRPGDVDIPRWQLQWLCDSGQSKEFAHRIAGLPGQLFATLGDAFVARSLGALLDRGDTGEAEMLAKRWAAVATNAEARAAAVAIQAIVQGDLAAAEQRLAGLAAEPSVPSPLPAMAWSQLGAELARREETARALAAMQSALRLRPDWPQARLRLFSSLLKAGRTDEARLEADWFTRKVEAGDTSLRADLEKMRAELEKAK